MPDDSTLTTALHSRHVALNARLVPFAGWEMPLQYRSIIEEHLAVRERSGIFDISHMGQIVVRGPGAESWLDRMLTNSVAQLAPGKSHYSFLLNDDGGIIDDLFVYRLGHEDFLLVVNASRANEVFDLFAKAEPGKLDVIPGWPANAAVAIQGPAAMDHYSTLLPGAAPLPERNAVIRHSTSTGDIVVARTGYTGEDGFEVFGPAETLCALWDRAVAAGIAPCGLGCRDSLRLEVCYPLNGSDLGPDRTPLEAGLGWAVDLNKPSFPGRRALVKQTENGVPSKLAAFRLDEPGAPPRPHYPIFHNGVQVGEVSSGTLAPSLKEGIGMGYMKPEAAKAGTPIEIEIRGKRVRATVARKPLYKK